MSIALTNRVKELDERVKALEALITLAAEKMVAMHERIEALENRPKPGRPPKNG